MAQTDQERQNGLVTTSAVLTALSFVVVTARSVVRIVLMRKGGWDDYLMILAMVSPEIRDGIWLGDRMLTFGI
ncbi:hypothetical protein IMZ48_08940 [Candidatus Bathyarchaeota archaeon]|nr:hypothetical protein [Candidatus Bathyarchaeota archaeon]